MYLLLMNIMDANDYCVDAGGRPGVLPFALIVGLKYWASYQFVHIKQVVFEL